MLKLREFNDNDWNGFAGATKFNDGSQPQIAEDDNFTVVADRTGVDVYIQDDCYIWNVSNTSKKVILVVAHALVDDLNTISAAYHTDSDELGFAQNIDSVLKEYGLGVF